MDLTRVFSADEFGRALGAWAWLGLEDLDPWFATLFGDVFLVGDDGVYLLDVLAGDLTRVFASPERAQQVLATEDGMDEYLLADLVFAAAEAGLEPAADEVFAFRTPPVLDGGFEVDNLEPMAFEEAVGRAGRLHDRIKDLPDGAEVGDLDLL